MTTEGWGEADSCGCSSTERVATGTASAAAPLAGRVTDENRAICRESGDASWRVRDRSISGVWHARRIEALEARRERAMMGQGGRISASQSGYANSGVDGVGSRKWGWQ